MVRGVVSLPHGTGKRSSCFGNCVLLIKKQEAKDAGADYVGLDEYIEKIKVVGLMLMLLLQCLLLWEKLGSLAVF